MVGLIVRFVATAVTFRNRYSGTDRSCFGVTDSYNTSDESLTSAASQLPRVLVAYTSYTSMLALSSVLARVCLTGHKVRRRARPCRTHGVRFS